MRNFALALVPLLLLGCDRQPVATGIPTISATGGAPDCPSCYAYAHGSEGGSRLLLAWGGGRNGLGLVPNSTPLPAGLALCLAMTTSPLDGVTDGDTLPGAIQNPEVLGCDRVFLPGMSYVIDYDAASAAAFPQVAARLTNGIDDGVHYGIFAVDGSLSVIHVLGGGGSFERFLTDRTDPPGASTAHFVGPDFVGFTVDFVRYRISDIQVGLETRNGALYLSYSFRHVWEFWGRNVQAS